MKKFNSILCIAATMVAALACNPEEKKDTTPAALSSFSFLMADNAILDADYAAEEISDEMIIRLPETNDSLVLVATLAAGENDEIFVNDEKVGEDGKISVEVGKAIDIIVTNSKSGLSSAYVVKVGKILKVGMFKMANYIEANSAMSSDYCLSINPSTKEPYIAYLSTPTDKKKNISVVKWDGKSLAAVGSLGLTPADESTVAVAAPATLGFNEDTPYIMYKGGDVKDLISVRKFSGNAWELVGAAGVNKKFTASYGYPEFYFVNGNPNFAYTGNNGSSDPGYRNAEIASFDGSAWSQTSVPFPELPVYGWNGSSGGMFYRACTTISNGAWYIVTSSNLSGYFVYKVNGASGALELVVKDFKPAGEEYGIPTCLDMFTAPDGKIYIIAGLSKNAKYQLYTLNEAAGTLDVCGNAITATAGGSGSIAEYIAVAMNPADGKIYAIMDDANDFPVLMYLNDQLQWTVIANYTDLPMRYSGEYQLAFAEDGTGYAVYSERTDKIYSLNFFKVGLEDDILPE